jgi:hypothetical protein
MPAKSKAQQAFMGAELGRLRAGKPTETGMKEASLRDFAKGKGKGLPARVPKGLPAGVPKGKMGKPMKVGRRGS